MRKRKKSAVGMFFLRKSKMSKFITKNEKGFYYDLTDIMAKSFLINGQYISHTRSESGICLSHVDNGIVLNLTDYKRATV